LYKDTKNVNTKSSYKLGELATPGSYTVKLAYGSLKMEDTFAVASITGLDIRLDNQTIVVTNIGNIPFNDVVYLDFNSGTYVFDEKLGLDPGEGKNLLLYDMVETGTYDIVVKYGSSEKRFSGVYIEGKKRVKLNIFYIILVILVILIIIYSLVLKNRKLFKIKLPKFEGKPHKLSHELRHEDSKDIFMKEKPRTRIKHQMGKANQGDIEYFKKKVVDDIKQTQQFGSDKRGSLYLNDSQPRNASPDNKGKGNLFNLFN
jgi:biopolymer transport protein ExbD